MGFQWCLFQPVNERVQGQRQKWKVEGPGLNMSTRGVEPNSKDQSTEGVGGKRGYIDQQGKLTGVHTNGGTRYRELTRT